MKTIYMTKGLPGSGKSTWAFKKMKAEPGLKRVNKDDLRAMVDGGRWSRANEKLVLQLRNLIIENALEAGHSIIVDDTNLHPKHEESLRDLASMFGANFEIESFIHVPLKTCIEQDLDRLKSVGEKVIRSMHRQFLEEKVEAYDGSGLPSCIIVDIDGTIALKKDRSPFDWHRVGEDAPHEKIIKLVSIVRLAFQDLKTIIFSGRDSVCREQTEQWLEDNGIFYDALYMRPEGNMEKDSIIKSRLFDEHIRGKYCVEYVFDDRNQVVEMWRSLGLTCLQVADGDF